MAVRKRAVVLGERKAVARWNKAMEAGGVMVGDEVAISIDVEAVKQ